MTRVYQASFVCSLPLGQHSTGDLPGRTCRHNCMLFVGGAYTFSGFHTFSRLQQPGLTVINEIQTVLETWLPVSRMPWRSPFHHESMVRTPSEALPPIIQGQTQALDVPLSLIRHTSSEGALHQLPHEVCCLSLLKLRRVADDLLHLNFQGAMLVHIFKT